MIKENLIELGLTHNEARAYMHLITNVKSKASELAKQLEVTHPAAKKILDNLINKKLVKSGQYGKTTYYFPEPSNNIVNYISDKIEQTEKQNEKKIRLAKETKSLIEGMVSLGNEDTDIKFYKGKEGINKMVQEIASSKNKTVYEFIDLDLTLYSKQKDTIDWSKAYKDNNIKFKSIMTSNKINAHKKNGGINTDVVNISKEQVLTPTAHLLVFDNKVAFSFITDDRSILIIKNKWIANTIQTLINNLKEKLKK